MLVEASVVEPVHPLQGRDFHMLDRPPRPARFDQLGLVEPVNCLGESVVVARPGRPDRGIGTDLNEPVGERN